VLDLTPLEKMLQNAGPLRDDGADRFFGLENVRRTLLTSATYPPTCL
jgi:ubiquitin carboxyl-terminal hydrolase 9/13